MRTLGPSLSPFCRQVVLSASLLGPLLGTACRSRAGEDGVAGGDAWGSPAASSASDVSAAPASAAPASSSGTSAAPSTPGRTVDVQMVGDAQGYRFVPATVTVRPGDAVRWTNASGGPHNVTFWSDSIPSGAVTWLQANMPQPMSSLTGPLLTSPNATYTIPFAGAQPGTYTYYCMPHLALGMKATIVVEP